MEGTLTATRSIDLLALATACPETKMSKSKAVSSVRVDGVGQDGHPHTNNVSVVPRVQGFTIKHYCSLSWLII